MSIEKQITLVKRIYDKTMAGDLDWKPSVRSDTFQISFSHYSLRLSEVTGEFENDYVVQIINENGEVADEISDNDLTAAGDAGPEGLNWYKAMGAMFVKARRIALGADKAIEDILGELDLPF